MNYYVYTHIFANNIRYVGKGKGYRATHFKNRNNYWANLFNKYGAPVVEITLQNLTEVEALYYEKLCINNYLLAGVPLCNLTKGGEGEGHPHTEAHKLSLQLNNPNKKIIHIYDNNDRLYKTYNGTLSTTKDNIPKNAFIRSHKNSGLPIGYTEQSRTELRKRMHQHFIGWYALEEGSIKVIVPPIENLLLEQTTGLFSTLPINSAGSNNPNAKTIYILDSNNDIITITNGNFAACLTANNWPKSLFEKAKQTQQPISTNRIKYKYLNGWKILLKDTYDNLKRTFK